jgi:hypothetical protein
MNLRGFDGGRVRPPLRDLEENANARIRKALDALGPSRPQQEVAA